MKDGRVRMRRRPKGLSHSLSISHSSVKRRRCREEEKDSMSEQLEYGSYLRKADYFHPMHDSSRWVKDMVSDSEFEAQEHLESSVGHEKKKVEHSDSGMDTDQWGPVEKTSLFEVQVTIKASYQEENGSYVCLISQLNGEAVIGHPLEIQVLKSDPCGTSHPKRKSGFSPLVWKTAKRTPVCYGMNSIYSPVSKNDALVNGDLVKEAKSRSCVPVGHIFSKILGGVGH